MVDRVCDLHQAIADESFKMLQSPDSSVIMDFCDKSGTTTATGVMRARTTLDADIAECAAYDFQVMARHFVKASHASGSLERAITTHNDHCFTGQQVIDLKIPTFDPREFVSRVVWRWENEKTLLVATETCDSPLFPIRASIVRGSVVSLAKFEKLEPIDDFPQTRLTWTLQPDLAGLVPKKLVNAGVVQQLIYASKLRAKFDQSKMMDAASASRLVDMIRAHGGEYMDEEQRIIEAGHDRLKMFEQMKTKLLKMESPSTKAKVAFADNNSHAWGWATTTVRAE